MIVVISIIGLLAAMIFPVTGALKRTRIRARAKTELAQVELAIGAYHAELGHYPPDNTLTPRNPVINQLYYELKGTELKPVAGGTYVTLDGSASLQAGRVKALFGADGIVNCTRGSGDTGQPAGDFLRELKAGQFLALSSAACTVLGTFVDGPGMLAGSSGAQINPWHYISSSPTNNPNSFDLWVNVYVGNKTNRVCNWSREPLIVNDTW